MCGTDTDAGLVRLTRYNAERLGRTRMFNVLAAEAGDPGHPAHAYFVRRYRELVDVMSVSLRHAVESGELRAGTDVLWTYRSTIATREPRWS
ncbi:hypothetical protein ACWCQQ_40185 [Streptomyces sp. NPDC002143]